jgi:mono/diheme cytochrome c family protein
MMPGGSAAWEAAWTVINGKCVGCHTGAMASMKQKMAGIMADKAATEKMTKAQADAIVAAVKNTDAMKRMPKGAMGAAGTALSDADIKALSDWAATKM